MTRLIFLILLGFPFLTFGQIRINEVSSSNGTVQDEFGDTPDWVEITNEGDQSVSLSTYYLSDDNFDLYTWNFPNVILSPGEFLTVFSRDEITSPVHFNFGISSEGETLYLSQVPGGLIQTLEIPELQADNSYGYSESLDGYFFFGQTTPGSENSSEAKTGYSSDFQLPVSGGYYSEPLEVNLDGLCPAGAFYFTLDGKFPTEQDSVAESILLENTVVLKGICLEPNKLPSNTKTASILINQTDVLPLISLSVDHDSLFHDSLGLYMPGPNVDSIWPFFGANYWEKRQLKTTFEYFENQSSIINQDVDLTIHGGKSSRNKRQRPLRLTARKRFGEEFINHAFFEEKPSVDEFKHLVLRNSGADFLFTNYRDGFWHQLVLKENLDFEVFGFQPAIVLINGNYWGVMNIRERVSEHYISENRNISPSEVLINEKELEPFLGDSIYFYEFKEFVINEDLSQDENFQIVQEQLDIHSYMDYFSTEIFSGNLDWPSNNIKYWKESPTEGKWRYIFYDLDTTAELFPYIPMNADLFYHIFVDKEWSVNSKIFISLLENAEFKRNFINRLADLMNTSFTEQNLLNHLNNVAAEFELQKAPHFLRWYGNMNNYELHANGLFPEFFSVRAGFVKEHVMEHFELENVVEIQFQVYPEEAGALTINSISPELPFTGDYFNGNSIDVAALSFSGNTFLRWDYSEEILEDSSNPNLNHNFKKSGILTAVFEDSNAESLSVLNSPVENGELNAVFNSNREKTYSISVFSPDGRKVYQVSELMEEGKNYIQINIPELSQGAYVLSVSSESEVHSAKFFKF